MGIEREETICAVATPPGEGGVGIVRVSGEKALTVASAVLRLRSGRSLEGLACRRLARADLVLGGGAGEERTGGMARVLDDVLVVVMRAPQSYTGETVVEIHCHGGALVLRLVCEGLVAAGARLAEPGEFTKRAFLNGRLDLTQAEAVLDTIRAQTEGGLRIAQEQLRGRLSGEVGRLREELIGLLAKVEAGIDFAEEDIAFISGAALREGIAGAGAAVARLIDSCREGRVFREGVATAIVGRPNVGKSSLLNALVETDRAIVTAVPGTTRDIIEETVNVRGMAVRLVDTAGIRRTEDQVEREGIRRSEAAIERAELVLVVVDGSVGVTEEDRELIRSAAGKTFVIAVNKLDLGRRVGEDVLRRLCPEGARCDVVGISAKTGAGLDDLRDRMRVLMVRGTYEPGASAMATRARHVEALGRAGTALEHAGRAAADGLAGECVAVDLRAAIDALGEITGAVTTDEILDRVFRDFCIGK